jgi:hypothetical protein
MKTLKTALLIALYAALGCGLFLVLTAWAVHAQTPPKFNFNTAKYEWQWSLGTGMDAKEWHWKCGPATGQYTQAITIVKGSPIAGATYQLPANKLLPAPGVWFCVNLAANDYGESAPTNEVAGDFGLAPVPAAKLVITP